MKTLAALAFLLLAGTGFSQEKNTTNGVTPQPQQLQNNGLNSTRSNKEQRNSLGAPAPGSAAPAPSSAPSEKTAPDTNNVAPKSSGHPAAGRKD